MSHSLVIQDKRSSELHRKLTCGDIKKITFAALNILS